MNMHIKTATQGCHVTVSIKVQSQTLVSLADNDDRHVNLLPGITYRFEWFVFTADGEAKARIEAVVTPANPGYPPLDINKSYPGGVQDGNVFLFTLTNT